MSGRSGPRTQSPATAAPPAHAGTPSHTPHSRASTPLYAAASAPTEPKKAAKVTTVENTPYFTPAQLERLLARARANKMPLPKWEQTKMAACSFIAAVGAKLGIPQRSIASAQLLYQRFHLFYPPSDFVVHQVALASLFTAAKLNDTQKRVQDVLLAGYALRFPELLTPPPGTASGLDWVAHAHVADADVDHEMLAQERIRLLTLERMMLQCICFQFEMRATKVLRLTVKAARRWALPHALGALAWRVACDAHRTPAPLVYPPQTVAVGSVYVAALLADANGERLAVLDAWTQPSAWPHELCTSADDAQEVALAVLAAYAAYLPGLERGAGALPACVSYPPPLGLLAWRRARAARSLPTAPADLEGALTQARIPAAARCGARA
ncbi:beta-glucosidase [Malassezia obtusa]|uniref:Beta-glucosidase n=1 Tax=Malassezia obtusa TaxID=76774 RepID=A0AAF0DWX8_9BASI|nr:beta-glucosidase [Malassezia obtusa]